VLGALFIPQDLPNSDRLIRVHDFSEHPVSIGVDFTVVQDAQVACLCADWVT
jgi:hypothetical protein